MEQTYISTEDDLKNFASNKKTLRFDNRIRYDYDYYNIDVFNCIKKGSAKTDSTVFKVN